MARNFTVMIAGAGMGGLMLGRLLELAGIDYWIFEKTPKVVNLGATMGFGPNIIPLFEQLGLLEELDHISKIVDYTRFLDENLNQIAYVDGKSMGKKLGYAWRICTRPEIHKLLLSKIPKHKVIFGKKILKVEEDETKVTLKFSDNTQASGHICVGADGGYSAVRQSLYKALDKRGVVPKKDLEELTFGFYNLLGITAPMDPEKYPALAATDCQMEVVQRSSTKHSIHIATVPGNRFCWNVSEHFYADAGPARVFRTSDWGSESAQVMCDEVRDFKVPFVDTVGDFIDATPKEAISKIMLEEKLFKTWYGSRTVLLGDACHKMLPSAGQGAANAMQDAVTLANNLYDLPDQPTLSDIQTAFRLYREERYPMAKMAFNLSHQQSKIIAGQSMFDRLMRRVVFNHIPQSIQDKAMEKPNAYRPQVNFLPMVPDKGVFRVLPRKPSKRYQEEMGRPKAV